MRLRYLVLSLTIGAGCTAANAQGVLPTPLSLTDATTVTQNFDTLANTGTSSTVPAGFGFVEAGSNGNTTYTAGTGSDTSGDTYSFGATGSTERALGQLRSGNLGTTIYGVFTNNFTGQTLQDVNVSYTGETWRVGIVNRPDRDGLTFAFATISGTVNAAALSGASYTTVAGLNYTGVADATLGAKNGNSTSFRTSLSGSFSPSVPVGSSLVVRWTDLDPANADDGIGIDDFSLQTTFQPVPAPPAAISLGIGSLVGLAGTGMQKLRLRAAKRKQAAK